MLTRLGTTFVLLVAGYGTTAALPLAPQTGLKPPVVPAANGCGPRFFRTIAGNCVPNRALGIGPRGRVIAPPPCPPGFLRDPNPARPLCYPVF